MAIFQRGAYYSGIKIFNTFPTEIKELWVNPKKFKISLKHFFVLTLFLYSGWILQQIVSFDKQYSMFFFRVILFVWNENRKQWIINSIKLYLSTIFIIMLFATFNDNNVI
jgi:hypothetical protein